jgi:hypothetical protein
MIRVAARRAISLRVSGISPSGGGCLLGQRGHGETGQREHGQGDPPVQSRPGPPRAAAWPAAGSSKVMGCSSVTTRSGLFRAVFRPAVAVVDGMPGSSVRGATHTVRPPGYVRSTEMLDHNTWPGRGRKRQIRRPAHMMGAPSSVPQQCPPAGFEPALTAPEAVGRQECYVRRSPANATLGPRLVRRDVGPLRPEAMAWRARPPSRHPSPGKDRLSASPGLCGWRRLSLLTWLLGRMAPA